VHGAYNPMPKIVPAETVGWMIHVIELGVFCGIKTVCTGKFMLKD
jgi:hypothetical protein